ncbi:SWIM zinc finger family protein [Nocardioides sp. GXZ039]|uniref:SWIM zinc finger family protein n=1 Tax=Nocardioides sp. GXZ039 TaxID=3136018 RepID=UPI0030F45A87
MTDSVVAHPPFPARRGAARATTWWGKAWVRAVEEAAYAESDLRRARSLARQGAVGGISLTAGRMVAAVADEHGLFTVDCRVPVLDAEALATLVETVAAESGRIGALLAHELPHGLVEHAEEAGVELLPFGTELEAACTCVGWLDPCPHALAVLSQTAWILDADPLALIHLRGLPRDDLLARLHARSTRASAHESGADDLDATVDLAADASARATRILDLLDSDSPFDHLL